MSNTKTKRKRRNCNHCNAIRYKSFRDYHRLLIYNGIDVVSLASGIYKYAVYAMSRECDNTDIIGMLKLTFKICAILSHKYGINEVRIVLNSHIKNKKNRKKDHLHAWIVMDSEESRQIFNKVWNTVNGYSPGYKKYKSIQRNPYKNDIVYDISDIDLWSTNNITDVFRQKNIRRTMNKSFYIFINGLNCGMKEYENMYIAY